MNDPGFSAWRLLLPLFLLAPVLLFITIHAGGRRAPEAPPEPEPAEQTLPSAPETELPEGWTLYMPTDGEQTEGTLLLVNRAHRFDAALAHPVCVYDNMTSSYLVKDTLLSLDGEALDALNRWMDAFAGETGLRDVLVVAGWRSSDDQQALYDNALRTKGQAYADAYLALPGASEHHTGFAVDLDTYDIQAGTCGGFDGAGTYSRAAACAWEYGFVQRYPEDKAEFTGIAYEPWHFRYVGLPHAMLMAQEGLCLEEYIDMLHAHPFEGEHLFVTCLGAEYEIYVCAGPQIAVPETGCFTLSGDNDGGFIVTVLRSGGMADG